MSDSEISLEEIQLDAEERMERCLESLQRDFSAIRSSRAAPSMVENLMVDAYDMQMPLNQLATISCPEPRVIAIAPFDRASSVKIEKAIMKSDLNLTPHSDGTIIRLTLPELTGERRQALVKQVKGRLEECRVALRNVRRDANDQIKKLTGKGHSEDEIKSAQDEIQTLTDRFSKKGEEIAEAKEKSILTI